VPAAGIEAGGVPQDNEQDHDDVIGASDDPNDLDEEEAAPPPPSSDVSTSKRRFSALGTPSTAISSVTSLSSASKRGRLSNAVVLSRLGDSLDDFNNSYRANMAFKQKDPSIDATVKRKAAAMDRAQDLETDLTSEQIAALLELFEAEANTADAYLNIKRDDVRKAWVRRKLQREFAFDM
jgi:hypothetical protein